MAPTSLPEKITSFIYDIFDKLIDNGVKIVPEEEQFAIRERVYEPWCHLFETDGQFNQMLSDRKKMRQKEEKERKKSQGEFIIIMSDRAVDGSIHVNISPTQSDHLHSMI